MNTQEAKSKAYFIAAAIIQGACERLPELIMQASEAAEISQEDMASIIAEMHSDVMDYLKSQGVYHRALAQKPPRVHIRHKEASA